MTEILVDIYISAFSVENESVLLTAFLKYILSQLYSNCTQNRKF